MIGLSTRIRQARLRAGMTQAALARRVGVKRSAATQWEHPSGTVPSMEHLIAVALATGVHLEWLATGRGLQTAAEDGEHGEHGEHGENAEDAGRAGAARRRLARDDGAHDAAGDGRGGRGDAVAADRVEGECLALLRALPAGRRRLALQLLRALLR